MSQMVSLIVSLPQCPIANSKQSVYEGEKKEFFLKHIPLFYMKPTAVFTVYREPEVVKSAKGSTLWAELLVLFIYYLKSMQRE